MSLSKYSSWSIPIYKLMHWRSNNWVKTHSNDMKKFLMTVYCDELIIYNDDKIIHRFNVNGKLKAIFKNDIFILLSGNHIHKVRKIRFLLKSSSRKINNCVKRLSALFPVVRQDAVGAALRSARVQQTAQSSLQNNKQCERELPLPPAYIEFIKLCLLDTSFPRTVMETEKILNSLLQNT